MKQPIFVISRTTKRCPFSKKIIKPKSMLCLFNRYQYNNFILQIVDILSSKLPIELIEKILEFTKYKNLLDRTGLERYTNWEIDNYKSSISMKRFKIRNVSLVCNTTSDEESSDNMSSDDEFNE